MATAASSSTASSTIVTTSSPPSDTTHSSILLIDRETLGARLGEGRRQDRQAPAAGAGVGHYLLAPLALLPRSDADRRCSSPRTCARSRSRRHGARDACRFGKDCAVGRVGRRRSRQKRDRHELRRIATCAATSRCSSSPADLQYEHSTFRARCGGRSSRCRSASAPTRGPRAKLVAKCKPRSGTSSSRRRSAQGPRAEPARAIRCSTMAIPRSAPRSDARGAARHLHSADRLKLEAAPFYKRTNGTMRASTDPDRHGQADEPRQARHLRRRFIAACACKRSRSSRSAARTTTSGRTATTPATIRSTVCRINRADGLVEVHARAVHADHRAREVLRRVRRQRHARRRVHARRSEHVTAQSTKTTSRCFASTMRSTFDPRRARAITAPVACSASSCRASGSELSVRSPDAGRARARTGAATAAATTATAATADVHHGAVDLDLRERGRAAAGDLRVRRRVYLGERRAGDRRRGIGDPPRRPR